MPLLTCVDCGYFGTDGFMPADAANCYDYQCPRCGSKNIAVEYDNDYDQTKDEEKPTYE